MSSPIPRSTSSSPSFRILAQRDSSLGISPKLVVQEASTISIPMVDDATEEEYYFPSYIPERKKIISHLTPWSVSSSDFCQSCRPKQMDISGLEPSTKRDSCISPCTHGFFIVDFDDSSHKECILY